MSVTEQERLIEDMSRLDENGQTYLLGVMAGLVAMQERRKDRAAGDDGRGAAESGEGAEG